MIVLIVCGYIVQCLFAINWNPTTFAICVKRSYGRRTMPKPTLYIFWIVLLLGIAGVMAVAASRGRLMPQPLPDRIAVVATFYPIAHFTQAVGGERVAVATLVGRGVEPHEYEPTARDRATVANANLFIIHGGSVDAWAGKMAAQLQTITVVAVSPASTDPHTWLDPLLARQMVTTIRDALIQIAPRERAFFEDTAARY